jgi:hypothetical protein
MNVRDRCKLSRVFGKEEMREMNTSAVPAQFTQKVDIAPSSSSMDSVSTSHKQKSYTIPPGCHPDTSAICTAMLQNRLTLDMLNNPILYYWWAYEDTSDIYTDCIKALYGIEMPQRVLNEDDRMELRALFTPYLYTGE